MERLDDTQPVEVAPGIWWIGFADREHGFSNNPYLLVDEDGAVLFDPGPGHPVFRDLVLGKIQQIIAPEQIRFVVVHHQDPDLCALIPHIEDLLHPEAMLLATARTAMFLPYYGIRLGIVPVGDEDCLELDSGRRIAFHHTPYLHFAGAMTSFDAATGSLFSSDLFGVVDRSWRLFADASYRDKAMRFLETYTCSEDALRFAHQRFSKLPIRRILPQHGAIIEEDVAAFLSVLLEARPGRSLEEVANPPSRSELGEIAAAAADWLEGTTGRPCYEAALDGILRRAAEAGGDVLEGFGAIVAEEAQARGVANPLLRGRVLHAKELRGQQVRGLDDGFRVRLLRARQEYLLGGFPAPDPEGAATRLSFEADVVTVFVDIRGFTAWSQGRPPEEIIRALERQQDTVGRIIAGTGGRVNKLLGDGTLAYFRADRVDAAFDTLLQLQRAISDAGLLPCGVGASIGRVVVGDIGDHVRRDFTLVGEPVNTASRMCDAAKPGQVVVSEALAAALGAEAAAVLLSRSPERVEVGHGRGETPTYGLRFTAV